MLFQKIALLPEQSAPEQRIKWYKQHDHFCAKPFHTLQIALDNNNQLYTRPCCNHVGEPGLHPLGDQFQRLRQDIMHGFQNYGCEVCWHTEKTNNYSERIRDQIIGPASIVNDLLAAGQIHQFNLGIKFSNLCNLACRSCGSHDSSTYARIKEESVVLNDLSDHVETWQKIQDLTREIVGTYPSVNIGLIGGETMLQPGAVRYIDFLLTLPEINKICLGITSNFTTLNERLLEHRHRFQRLDITASIDSVGDNYTYVRWPAQFAKVEANVRAWQQQYHGNNTTFTLASVWSLNNIFYINEYLDWLQECYLVTPDLRLHVLHLANPPQLAVECIPTQYRSDLASVIRQALDHQVLTRSDTTAMQFFLRGILEFLGTDRAPPVRFESFLRFTADFDRRTQTSFKTANNRLYQLLSDQHREYYHRYHDSA